MVVNFIIDLENNVRCRIVHNVPPKICPPGRFALVYNVSPDILH